MNDSRFRKGSNQYVKRLKPLGSEGQRRYPELHPALIPIQVDYDESQIDLSHIKKRTPKDALARMQRTIPEHIWNAAALEGNTYTLPEVRTLLDNVTVGGHTHHETDQINALKSSFALLDSLVRSNAFEVSKEVSNSLHAEVAKHEALDAGCFRGQGTPSLSPGVTVSLASGGIAEGAYYKELDQIFDSLRQHCEAVEDKRLAALIWCAGATRAQFYFDGNKRTSRLVASGILMSHGYDAVRVPVSARPEYNQTLDTLFATGDATDFIAFLASTFTD